LSHGRRSSGALGSAIEKEKILRIRKDISEKTILANRVNAGKSTGPRSAAGKSAVRYNAVQHGLLTKALSFGSEDDKENFQQLAGELEKDLNPDGTLQSMLVEEIAVIWWKLRTVQHLQLEQLSSREKISTAILNTYIRANQDLDPFSAQPDGLRATADRNWECQELLLTVDRESAEKDSDSDTSNGKTGRIAFQAKLANSAESLLRYESSWKKDLYRAITALKLLQQDQ
jgi:hypothetical protein